MWKLGLSFAGSVETSSTSIFKVATELPQYPVLHLFVRPRLDLSLKAVLFKDVKAHLPILCKKFTHVGYIFFSVSPYPPVTIQGKSPFYCCKKRAPAMFSGLWFH